MDSEGERPAVGKEDPRASEDGKGTCARGGCGLGGRVYGRSTEVRVWKGDVHRVGVWICWQELWTLHGRAHLERRRAQGGGVNLLAGAMDTPLTSSFGKAMWTAWG